jgi:uncharacterized protein (TIGR02145 family)
LSEPPEFSEFTLSFQPKGEWYMKTQTLLRSIFGVAVIALLLSMVSCDSASNPSALVGRWVGVSGEDKDGVMELLSDGTGIATRNSVGIAITWKTEKDRFYFTASGVAQAANYKLQDVELTFTEDNGKVSKYMKCNKNCEETAKEYAKAEAEKALADLKAKVKKGSFVDSRDGKTYKTVKLENQTWMAENLNYNADGTKCYGEGGLVFDRIKNDNIKLSPDEIQANCQKYGRLYNWSTAKSACPSGWHLPSDVEWQVLVDLAGGDEVAGNMLKASSGWDDLKEKSGNGEDAFGFSALPGGTLNENDGNFYTVGLKGEWWSRTERSYHDFASGWEMSSMGARRYPGKPGLFSVLGSGKGKTALLSVRCIQD